MLYVDIVKPHARTLIDILPDIVCEVVQRQVLNTFQISGTRCACTADLLDLLCMVSEVKRHNGKPMPLLINRKVHHALIRFLYGKDYVRFTFKHFLLIDPRLLVPFLLEYFDHFEKQ